MIGHNAPMSRLRVVLFGVLGACACGEKSDDEGGGSADGSGTSASSGAPTEASGASTSGATTAGAEESTAGPIADECASRPGGGWNACKADGQTDNDLCGFTAASGGSGKVTCLTPTSGAYNSCGVFDCVDDCDCYAPPSTGTAFPVCKEVFANGGKGCVLWCVNGQTCPDGMACVSGTCYWPN